MLVHRMFFKLDLVEDAVLAQRFGNILIGIINGHWCGRHSDSLFFKHFYIVCKNFTSWLIHHLFVVDIVVALTFDGWEIFQVILLVQEFLWMLWHVTHIFHHVNFALKLCIHECTIDFNILILNFYRIFDFIQGRL